LNTQSGSHHAPDTKAYVAHTLRGEGFDASEDGTGRGTPIVPVRHPIAIQERAVSENPDAGPDGKGWRDDGAAYTLEARSTPQVIAFSSNMSVPDCQMDGTTPTLKLGGHGGGNPPAIAFSSKDYGADATEDCSPTPRAGGHNDSHANAGVPPAVVYPINMQSAAKNGEKSPNGLGIGAENDPSPTLGANDKHAVAYSIMPMNSGKDYKARETDVAQPLMAAGPVGGNQGGDFVAYPIISDADRADSAAKTPSPDAEGRVRLRDPGLGVGGEADPMYTLQATKPHAVAYQTASREVAGTLTSNYGKQPDSSDTSLGPNLAMAFKIGAGAQAGSIGFEEEVSPTLTSTDSGTQRSPGLLQQSAVRRLTPVECERLQGFPDNFTAIPWGKKAAEDCPDGPRYKALGNSMAVPVMRWIGERIQMVDDLVSVL
jgi:DNA (cytosine-5)-methyltransferase 1